MSDTLSDVFGMVLMGASALLAVWEQIVYSRRHDNPWLVTRRRYRRRMLISVVLALVGCLIVLESRRLLDIHRVPVLGIYVVSLGTLSILLVVLAAIDVADTARNAVRHSLGELEKALEQQRKKSGKADEGESDD